MFCFLLAAGVWAQEEEKDKDKGLEAPDKARILESVLPGLVKVEYSVRYDKGEAPYGYEGYEEYIREERPVEKAGYLVSGEFVVTADQHINPRFIKGIAVSFEGKSVDAVIDRYMTDRDAVILKLSGKLEGAVPFTFDKTKEAPYFCIHWFETDAEWHTLFTPFDSKVFCSEKGVKTMVFEEDCLVVDREGVPVAISMRPEVAMDEDWKISPLDWDAVSAAEYEAGIEKIKKLSDSTVIRITLNFRSPKKKAGGGGYSRYGGGGDSTTEMQIRGVVMDKRNVLVPAKLSQKVTARLEKITLHLPGKDVEADFNFTLLEYGGLIATAKEDLPVFAKPYEGDIFDVKFQMLYGTEVRINGEQRIQYANRYIITGYELGKKKEVYPDINSDSENVTLFTPGGELVAIELGTREKGVSEDDWRYSSSSGFKQYRLIRDLLNDPEKNKDPDNIPLNEENENRLAWVGVELQALDQELARFNNVSQYSKDGAFGAIVSYVYKGSPADRAGVKQGDIFLKVQVEGEPKPYNIDVSEGRWGGRPFPWSRLDEVPEQYFDRIPPPWPSVETEFIRVLTDYGFDKKYKAEFFIDGKIVQKEMVIEETPPYYETAKKYKNEPLGVTVRNITYELRRYFQMKPDDPGVIISKIEPGSKTSVAGIKPYEIITHINDEPIHDVTVFESKIPAEGEIRFNVKRMVKSRVVKIKLEASEEIEDEE